MDAYTRECLALEVDIVRQPGGNASVGRSWSSGDNRKRSAGRSSPAFSGVVRGAADRVGAHSARQADADRGCRELSRTATRGMFGCFQLIDGVAEDRGVAQGQTRNVRTAVWDTAHEKSSQRCRQRTSTQLSEGQAMLSLAPRAPPARLKPERETNRLVEFLT